MTRLRFFCSATLAIGLIGLTACKPPPTDADLTRDRPEAGTMQASVPQPSPETQGALWTLSPQNRDRLIYGVPGSPALIALTCLPQSPSARLAITRLSPADKGAGALLALVGNGHIGRIKVDAVDYDGQSVWRGEALASDPDFEPLAGPRSLSVTVPGAGIVRVDENAVAMQFVERCRRL
jgi:hypothetical protein